MQKEMCPGSYLDENSPTNIGCIDYTGKPINPRIKEWENISTLTMK